MPSARGRVWDVSSQGVTHYGHVFRERHGDLFFAAAATAYFLPTFLVAPTRDCIAIHVRRGDSCGKDDGYWHIQRRKCPPFDYFFNAAVCIRSKYGWSNVYVATDSSDLQGILQSAKDHGFDEVKFQKDGPGKL